MVIHPSAAGCVFKDRLPQREGGMAGCIQTGGIFPNCVLCREPGSSQKGSQAVRSEHHTMDQCVLCSWLYKTFTPVQTGRRRLLISHLGNVSLVPSMPMAFSLFGMRVTMRNAFYILTKGIYTGVYMELNKHFLKGLLSLAHMMHSDIFSFNLVHIFLKRHWSGPSKLIV